MIFAGIAGAEVGMTTSKPRRAPGETLAASGAGRELTQPGSVKLCVPRTSSTSCDQAVFVDHATDASVSSDTVLLKIDRFG